MDKHQWPIERASAFVFRPLHRQRAGSGPDKTRNKRETIDGCAGKVLIPFTIPDNVIGRAFKRPFDALETHRSRARRSLARSLARRRARNVFAPQNATRGDATTAINNRHGIILLLYSY